MMTTISKILLVSFTLFCIINANARESYTYTVAPEPWPENLGNHRAIIKILGDTEVAHLNLEWRRHDRSAEQRRFIIKKADGKDSIPNIFRLNVNNERCELLFGPVTEGTYYFYYLPYEPQSLGGYYTKGYLPRESEAVKEWLEKNAIGNKTPGNFTKASCVEIQSRTAFDSFYPMEVIATDAEKKKLQELNKENFMLFPEDRKNPIRMLDNIPQRWINLPFANGFTGEASQNEYYTFQVGLWALQSIEDVKVEFGPLKGNNYTLPPSALTCFNTEGVDPSGKPFIKDLNVAATLVQPLWIGVDLPEDIPVGQYSGKLTIVTKYFGKKDLPVTINVNNSTLSDRGDSEMWRHSRLRWLNSTAGIDDNNVSPYSPVNVLANGGVDLTGKEVHFTPDGLPSSIKVYGEEVLAAPISFSIHTGSGRINFTKPKVKQLKLASGVLSKLFEQKSKQIKLRTYSDIEFDGWMKYTFEIEALEDLDLSDVNLVIPYRNDISKYIMGMGLPGTETPANRESKWEGPYTSFLAIESPSGLRFDNGEDLNYGPYDSFWLGSPKGGLHCELRGASYTGPQLNLFKPGPPISWGNSGKGGFKIRTEEKQQNAIAYSGERKLKKGQKLVFECAFIITPVKKLETHNHFSQRYYHNSGNPNPTEKDLELGVKVINLHHANKYNPYINYPFIAVEEMKDFVDKWHSKDMKVKIYNSVTGISNYATEIWALRSLGTEIIKEGDSEGFIWLREHFLDNYSTIWYQPLENGDIDASVFISSQSSRWYNYYIEGLRYLVKNIGIDGIYLDGAAYDRDMLKRIRKVVSQDRPDFLMDLHSHRWADAGSALQYADFYPYVNKLWFGEMFMYNEMPPANWLVETSGIPFGLMGDMLEGGGNIWRGMLYGMSERLGWSANRPEIWKLWDNFGIGDSKIVGYWDENSVVTTSNKDVLATAYLKDKKMLVSIASWAEQTVLVDLDIDFKRIGLDPTKVTITAPKIKNIQPEKKFKIGDQISVDPLKGWLLVIE